MSRAVICDLGGVVIRIDPDRIRQGWAARSTLTATEVHRAYPDEVYEAFERDEVSPAQYLAHVRDRLRLHGTDEELDADFNRLYLGIDAAVVRLLAKLRRRGALMVALTNTNRLHERVWAPRFAEELTVFDAIHCSHDLGARKPEPGAFTAVLEAHGLVPDEAVFIDDTPAHVAAARTVGLEAVRFHGADDLARQLHRFVPE